jgi:hypothetical protein
MDTRSSGGSSIARAVRRRAQRGAIMTEGVVVIPFFIIIFVSMIFIGGLYEEKLRTHKVSMKDAWASSLRGCTGAGPGPLPMTQGMSLGEASGTPQAALCNTGFSKLAAEATGAVQRPNALGGGTQTATTFTQLICDERPETGQFEGAAQFLWDQFADEMPVTIAGGTP